MRGRSSAGFNLKLDRWIKGLFKPEGQEETESASPASDQLLEEQDTEESTSTKESFLERANIKTQPSRRSRNASFDQLAVEAIQELVPEKKETRDISLKYSRAFDSFNGNVRYTRYRIDFRVSAEWKDVSPEIQKGFIQYLAAKAYRLKKVKTMNTDMYDTFLKSLPDYSPAQEIDPTLQESFDRVNEEYFHGLMDTPNLVWGSRNFRTLGTYDYAKNTITMSTVLQPRQDLLDFVMYHEMLHKKLKFKTINGRSFYHTPQFKRLEAEWKVKDVEDQLTKFLRARKRQDLITAGW